MIKYSFFYEWYRSNKKNGPKRLNIFWRIFFLLCFIFIVIFAIWWNKLGIFPNGAFLFLDNLKSFFNPVENNANYPDHNFWQLSGIFLLSSFQFLWSGTLAGFTFALFTAYLVGRHYYNKTMTLITKLVIVFLRAFPIFVGLYLFNLGFSINAAPFFIFAWFTWLWLHKYILGLINSCDHFSYYVALKKGNWKFVAFYQQILPRIGNKLFVLFLYAFESNLMWSFVLTALGVPGIGDLIYLPLQLARQGFNEILIPMFIVVLVLIFIELVIIFFEKIFIYTKSKNIKTTNVKQLAKKEIFKKNIKTVLILIAFALFCYGVSQLNWSYVNNVGMKDYLVRLFNPNLIFWSLTGPLDNPFLMLFTLFTQTILVIVLAYFFGILYGIFSSRIIWKNYFFMFFRTLAIILRILPSIFLFYLFNPIFANATTTVILVLGFHYCFSLAKKITSSIDNLSAQRIQFLRNLNVSWFVIFRDYIFASIRNDVKAYLAFDVENIFRALVIFGTFGSSLIVQKINNFQRLNQIENMASYVWLLWITIFFIDIFMNLWLKKINNEIKISFRFFVFNFSFWTKSLMKK